MSAHLGGLGETLAAFFTHEWLLPRVGTNMVVQRRCSSKRARAETTFKRTLVVVGHYVSPQLCWVSERQATMTTLEWVVCLTWAYMKSQCRTLCKPLLTLTAFPHSNLFVVQSLPVCRWRVVCGWGDGWGRGRWGTAVRRGLSAPLVVNTRGECLTYFRRKLTWQCKTVVLCEVRGWAGLSEVVGMLCCDALLHPWNWGKWKSIYLQIFLAMVLILSLRFRFGFNSW